MRIGSFRAWAIVVGVVAVLGLLLWAFRIELLLAVINYQAGRAQPVEPTREVVWGGRPVLMPTWTPGAVRPNIVLILADDLGWNDLSFNGGGIGGGAVATPHIDSIARDGVNFIQGYAANATCAPSRAALMSGRYSTRFGFEFTPTPAVDDAHDAHDAERQRPRHASHVLRRGGRPHSLLGHGHAAGRNHPGGTVAGPGLSHRAHRQVASRAFRRNEPHGPGVQRKPVDGKRPLRKAG